MVDSIRIENTTSFHSLGCSCHLVKSYVPWEDTITSNCLLLRNFHFYLYCNKFPPHTKSRCRAVVDYDYEDLGHCWDSCVHGLIVTKESCVFTTWAFSVLILTCRHSFIVSLSYLFISFENVYFMVPRIAALFILWSFKVVSIFIRLYALFCI